MHGNENRFASPEDQTRASLARTEGPARTAISRLRPIEFAFAPSSLTIDSDSEFGRDRNIRIRNAITGAGRRAMAHKGNYGRRERSRQFLSKRRYLLSGAICVRHKYGGDNQITCDEESQGGEYDVLRYRGTIIRGGISENGLHTHVIVNGARRHG